MKKWMSSAITLSYRDTTLSFVFHSLDVIIICNPTLLKLYRNIINKCLMHESSKYYHIMICYYQRLTSFIAKIDMIGVLLYDHQTTLC